MLEMECWESSANNTECGREGRVKGKILKSLHNIDRVPHSKTLFIFDVEPR